MARQPRIEYPGALYHVISRGIERRNLFRDQADHERYLGLLEKSVARFGFRLYAYCLMSNHVHLAVETGRLPLSRIMRSINTTYASYFNVRHQRSGYLFQGRYKAFLVDADGYLLSLIRYIHENPVKAGIVSATKDYRWSSHLSYFHQTPAWLAVDEVLQRFGRNRSRARKNFDAFFRELEDAPYAEAHPHAQLVIGEDDFAGRVLERQSDPPLVVRHPTPDRFVRWVASREGVAVIELRGDGRTAKLAHARSLCGLLASSAGLSVASVARDLRRTQSALWRQANALEDAATSDRALSAKVARDRASATRWANNA